MIPSVFFVIPARGGSKRLHRKNLQKLLGKPLIQYAIEACKKSNYYDSTNVYVTSEDQEILKKSEEFGISVISRPAQLAEDGVWTQDVLQHAITQIPGFDEKNDNHILVRVQANSPQVQSVKIDECVQKLIEHNLWEVFTVDQDGIEDAAIHVMRSKCVNQSALSVYKGIVQTDYVDIHNAADLHRVAEMMRLSC